MIFFFFFFLWGPKGRQMFRVLKTISFQFNWIPVWGGAAQHAKILKDEAFKWAEDEIQLGP